MHTRIEGIIVYIVPKRADVEDVYVIGRRLLSSVERLRVGDGTKRYEEEDYRYEGRQSRGGMARSLVKGDLAALGLNDAAGPCATTTTQLSDTLR